MQGRLNDRIMAGKKLQVSNSKLQGNAKLQALSLWLVDSLVLGAWSLKLSCCHGSVGRSFRQCGELHDMSVHTDPLNRLQSRVVALLRRSAIARHSPASGKASTTINSAPASSQRCSSARSEEHTSELQSPCNL